VTLSEWAARWSIPVAAIQELQAAWGVPIGVKVDTEGTEGSESRQQSLVRIEAAQMGVWLTRNNVGALQDERGVPVRFGLANESKEQNKRVKSADLIGIRPIVITAQHVGTTIGQFVSREMKHATWTYKGDAHEQAQLRWCQFVLSKGGDAAFCTGPGSFITTR
jgi:hypothetical protein